MIKYYKLNGEVYGFESDGSQDNLITQDMTLMTATEIDKHLNPEKYLSPEAKYDLYLKSLRPLTRRQFKLTLLKYDLLEEVETKFAEIQDAALRARMQIEYNEATEFQRLSTSVAAMIQILGLTSNQVNTMWEWGLTQ